jgi:hypothetical protein
MTPESMAIHYGESLAKAAEAFMEELNRSHDAGEDPDVEYWLGMRIAIHEFRKAAKVCG